MVLVGWQAFQIAILMLQDKKGPRFFIPKKVCELTKFIEQFSSLHSIYLKNTIIIVPYFL